VVWKMLKNKLYLILILGVLFPQQFVHGYELGTHARITNEALGRSVFTVQQLARQLGVEDEINPFGIYYYDSSVYGVSKRRRWLFEESGLRMPDGSAPLSIAGWLMRGAIREDDIPDYWPFLGKNPQDDPDGKIPRVRNHFYDPVNRRSLEVAGVSVGMDAPTWATGSEEAFGCPNCEDLSRRNHFTVMDAREAMYRALTGQDKFGNTAIGPNGQQADGSYNSAGVWNYLSNGDLSTLFSINDPQVSFWPVGLY